MVVSTINAGDLVIQPYLTLPAVAFCFNPLRQAWFLSLSVGAVLVEASESSNN